MIKLETQVNFFKCSLNNSAPQENSGDYNETLHTKRTSQTLLFMILVILGVGCSDGETPG